MNTRPLMFTEPPELSDEAAAQMLDLLYQLMDAFEFHYYAHRNHPLNTTSSRISTTTCPTSDQDHIKIADEKSPARLTPRGSAKVLIGFR